MSSIVRIDLTIPSSAATFTAKTLPRNTAPHESFENLSSYFASIGGGVYAGKVNETTGAVRATGTVTFSSSGPTNTEAMTIANVTVTAVSGTPSGNQIKTNSSATVVAAELAALINSSSSFTGILSATSAAGVVTMTSLAPGYIGNGIELAVGNFANTAVSAFSGGTETARYVYSVGQ